MDLTERPGRGPDLAGIALGKTGKLLLPLLMSQGFAEDLKFEKEECLVAFAAGVFPLFL